MLEQLRNTARLKITYLSALVVILFLATASGYAREPLPVPENLSAPIYVVSDARTGSILAERDSERLIAPASLTKLMTLNLSLQDVESGELSYYRTYPVPSEGSAASMRPGSSKLGLIEGDEVTLLTLQRAAAIASANDAAWSLAVLSGGTPSDFFDRMNEEASRLGMSDTHYVDPDGWSERSHTSASDQIRLAEYYIKSHPGVLENLHALPEMPYMNADEISHRPRKRNTNLLLGRVEGVDGLKTGTIPSAGFHFLATAEREDTRFLVLVMGIQAGNYVDGLNRRSNDAETLLEWAFANYYTWEPQELEDLSVPVRHGVSENVLLKLTGSAGQVTLRVDGNPIVRVIDIPEKLTAPVLSDQELGMVRWYQDGTLLMERSLTAVEQIDRRWRLKDVFR